MIESQEEKEGEDSETKRREDNPVNLTPPAEKPSEKKKEVEIEEDKMEIEKEDASGPSTQAACKVTTNPPTNGN